MHTGIIWIRNALRLNDNRVLVESLNSTNSQNILPLYILDKSDLRQKNNDNRIKVVTNIGDNNGNNVYLTDYVTWPGRGF